MSTTMRVLMVCMGNICRSPSAEAVLRKQVADAGLDVEVDSAGTHGMHAGEPPDARAVKHGKARGYDLSKLRARRVVRDDFERFDWILAMDADNLGRLREMAPPECRARVGLLLEHSPRYAEVREVPDPYYGAPAGFDRVLDLIEDGCAGFIARLRAERGTS